MAIPAKYYIPAVARLVRHACLLINKHENKMKQVVQDNVPGLSSTFNSALDDVKVACAIFLEVWHALDPNSPIN